MLLCKICTSACEIWRGKESVIGLGYRKLSFVSFQLNACT